MKRSISKIQERQQPQEQQYEPQQQQQNASTRRRKDKKVVASSTVIILGVLILYGMWVTLSMPTSPSHTPQTLKPVVVETVLSTKLPSKSSATPVQEHLQAFTQQKEQPNPDALPISDNPEYPIIMNIYNGTGVDPFYLSKEIPPSDGTNLWDSNPNIPNWMKAYFNWHKWRRANWKPEQWADDRWMILQCLRSLDKRRCGGTADRLKPLPTLLRLAYEQHRMLLIRWTRPATLEEFLVPPKNGIDWRVPDWMAEILETETNGRRFVPSKIIQKYGPTNLTLMRTRYQSNTAGSDLYNRHVNYMGLNGTIAIASTSPDSPVEPSFGQVFAHVWKIFFRPSLRVEERIRQELERMQLVPGQYVASHLRALYAVEERPLRVINRWSQNSINCASELRPGAPIFFASDSAHASALAKEYSRRMGGRLETHTPNPNPPLHLDRDKEWATRQPSEYDDTFVDLYLIALAGCVTYNKGGYGHWGLLIGGRIDCRIDQEPLKNGHPGRICSWHDGPDTSKTSSSVQSLPKQLFLEPMI